MARGHIVGDGYTSRSFVRLWPHGFWPTCSQCRQSMSASYNGVPRCLRCAPSRWLVK